MLIRKGTTCHSRCCGREYEAQFNFEPKKEPMIYDGVVYLTGTCFMCLFYGEILPELTKHNIVLANV